MVMSHGRTERLKPLLDTVPPGFLVETRWLRGRGIDAKSIHQYRERGWLERVVRGVYRRPLPQDVADDPEQFWLSALLSLQWILDYDVHLGGESALELAGYAHDLSLGWTPRVHLYGEAPSWLKRLPTRTRFVTHGRNLFGDDRAGVINVERDGLGMSQAITAWRWPIRASSPERAILEALEELPRNARFDRLDRMFEGLTRLRPKELMRLLTVCRSVKVRRLFFVFADRHQHAWRKYLDTSKIDLGAGPRALVKNGWLHPVYRIYVPRYLADSQNERVDGGA